MDPNAAPASAPSAPTVAPAGTAQTQVPPPGKAGPPPSPFANYSFLLMMLAMFGIMYFMMIRPESKQRKARKAMLDALQKNDQVLTIGGVHGTVAAVNEDTVTLRIDDSKDVRIKVARGAIQTVLERGEKAGG